MKVTQVFVVTVSTTEQGENERKRESKEGRKQFLHEFIFEIEIMLISYLIGRMRKMVWRLIRCRFLIE